MSPFSADRDMPRAPNAWAAAAPTLLPGRIRAEWSIKPETVERATVDERLGFPSVGRFACNLDLAAR